MEPYLDMKQPTIFWQETNTYFALLAGNPLVLAPAPTSLSPLSTPVPDPVPQYLWSSPICSSHQKEILPGHGVRDEREVDEMENI